HSSTLFPYTTLFRSLPSQPQLATASESLCGKGQNAFAGAAHGRRAQLLAPGCLLARPATWENAGLALWALACAASAASHAGGRIDRKSTRLNSSHVA